MSIEFMITIVEQKFYRKIIFVKCGSLKMDRKTEISLLSYHHALLIYCHNKIFNLSIDYAINDENFIKCYTRTYLVNCITLFFKLNPMYNLYFDTTRVIVIFYHTRDYFNFFLQPARMNERNRVDTKTHLGFI